MFDAHPLPNIESPKKKEKKTAENIIFPTFRYPLSSLVSISGR